ncbi:MAG: c-type cytochrome, partial [Planctomycetaceae bacterium]|nr:c-type cytochrome [Planctomycetaceae bacterium]
MRSQLTLLLIVLCTPAWADDEENWNSGLLATYTCGSQQVRRIERDVFVQSGPGAPLEEIAADDFSVQWQGQLIVRDQLLTLHAWLQGAVTIRIADQVVLQAEQGDAGWVSSDAFTVPYGFQPLDITFRSAKEASALKLYVSSPSFPLEPLAPQSLFHKPATQRGASDNQQWDRGRQLFTAHRCDRCHAVNDQPTSDPAPALWGVMQGINPDWLTKKLLTTHAEQAESKMPHFGFDQAQAEAIAAYLVRLGSPSELMRVPTVNEDKKNPLPSGQALLHSLGCLGCHQIGELGTSGPFTGPNLSHIGAKRSPEWLATWLFRPERINPQHSMPVFKLSASERGLLVDALSKLGAPAGVRFLAEGEEHFPRD